METECTSSADASDAPELFLHVRFEVPSTASPTGGNFLDDENDDDDGARARDDARGSAADATSVVITEQRFDSSNCEPAVIGLPDGIEPVKVRARVRACFLISGFRASQSRTRRRMVVIRHP